MGSRYGLLLASGARRYCRAAIRAALAFSLSPSTSAVIRSFLRVLLVPHQREWWCMGPREEEGLVGWESFRRARRHTKALYADTACQKCIQLLREISFSIFSAFDVRFSAYRFRKALIR